MPEVNYKGRVWRIKWRPEWDDLLRKVANDWEGAKAVGRVPWIEAIDSGDLDSLPKALLGWALNEKGHKVTTVSNRWAFLKSREREGYVEKNRAHSLAYYKDKRNRKKATKNAKKSFNDAVKIAKKEKAIKGKTVFKLSKEEREKAATGMRAYRRRWKKEGKKIVQLRPKETKYREKVYKTRDDVLYKEFEK